MVPGLTPSLATQRRVNIAELSMGWVDPLVEFGW